MICRTILPILIFATLSIVTPNLSAAENSKPNILLCVADDAGLHAGAYGTDWVKTPAMDRLAENGLVFTRAYTPDAKCGPSRACILTGRNSWQLKSAANHWSEFPREFKSVAEVFDESGYKVGYTGKGWQPGVAFNEDGSNRDLLVKRYNRQRLEPPTSGIKAVDYVANFKQFLDGRKNDEPFFFWYGGWEPHRKYEFQSGRKVGGKSLDEVKWIPEFWPDTDAVRDDILDYVYELEYFDAQLGKMLDDLEGRGLLENTIIVVTSDNGMPFPRMKGQAYEYSNHLPLIVFWPKGIKAPGRSVEDFVSLIDLAPTFLEAAEISEKESGMASITGRSLTPILENRESDIARDHVLLGKERHDIGRPNDVGYPIRAIVEGDFLYIINFEPSRWPSGNPVTGYPNTDGSPTKTAILETRIKPDQNHYWQWNFGKRSQEELYDISKDPACLHNLAGYPEHFDKRNQLRLKLLESLNKEDDPRILGNGDVFDTYPCMDEDAVNFYERRIKGLPTEADWLNESDFESSDIGIESLK